MQSCQRCSPLEALGADEGKVLGAGYQVAVANHAEYPVLRWQSSLCNPLDPVVALTPGDEGRDGDDRQVVLRAEVEDRRQTHHRAVVMHELADRAHTIRLLAREDSTASDFNRPGHVVPLRARHGGVLVRGGHTEAAVDLCQYLI